MSHLVIILMSAATACIASYVVALLAVKAALTPLNTVRQAIVHVSHETSA